MLPLWARVNLGAVAIKGSSAFPKAPGLLDPLFSVISWTLVAEVVSLGRRYMKCEELHAEFELGSPGPFPTVVTITSQAHSCSWRYSDSYCYLLYSVCALKATQMDMHYSLIRDLHFTCSHLGNNTVLASKKNFCWAKDECVIDHGIVTGHFKKFLSDCGDLNDQARSGELSISQFGVVRHLHDLCKKHPELLNCASSSLKYCKTFDSPKSAYSAVDYTDYISADGLESFTTTSVLDMTPNSLWWWGSIPEVWGIWSTPLLPLLLGPLCIREVVPVRVPLMSHIELFINIKLNY